MNGLGAGLRNPGFDPQCGVAALSFFLFEAVWKIIICFSIEIRQAKFGGKSLGHIHVRLSFLFLGFSDKVA